MRIRTALATGVLAATFVVGGAGGALAHGGEHHKAAELGGEGTIRSCQIHAGIHHHNPYYDQGCFGAGLKFFAKKEASWQK